MLYQLRSTHLTLTKIRKSLTRINVCNWLSLYRLLKVYQINVFEAKLLGERVRLVVKVHLVARFSFKHAFVASLVKYLFYLFANVTRSPKKS